MTKQFFLIIILATASVCGFSTIFANTNSSIVEGKQTTHPTFSNLESKNSTDKFKKKLQQIEDIETFKTECDEKQIVNSCYTYAGYLDLILDNERTAYKYHIKAFDLGRKESGLFIANKQINNPEMFNDSDKLTIDENIEYLEQAFNAGSIDAVRLLMMVYRDSDFNRVNYEKSEYYNKIAIKKNVKNSRAGLAILYLKHMQDKSKIDSSLKLLQENLVIENHVESAFLLAAIYTDGENYGTQTDDVKGLAYLYILRDMRNDDWENTGINILETEFLNSGQIQEAKKLYQEVKAKMNAYANNKTKELVSP